MSDKTTLHNDAIVRFKEAIVSFDNSIKRLETLSTKEQPKPNPYKIKKEKK